jgi:uncharacterized protein YndB with AHSA1/START domain
MSTQAKSRFVYVTYIRTTPQKLWDALTKPEFQRIYWGSTQDSTFEKGASWSMTGADSGTLFDAGEVLESEPPRKLVIKWRNEWKPELTAEGYGRCTYDIADGKTPDSVKLTIAHENDVENSKYIAAVSTGWPSILSNLKTWLETGTTISKP